jgi:hypothetical protein
MGVLHCILFHGMRFNEELVCVTRDKVEGQYALCNCGAEYFKARHRIIRVG